MFPSRLSATRPKGSSSAASGSTRVCQKCLSKDHATFECPSSSRPYASRPTASQLLSDAKLKRKQEEKTKELGAVPEELRKEGTADKILSKRKAEQDRKEGKSRQSHERQSKGRKSRPRSSTVSSASSYTDSSNSSSLSTSDTRGASPLRKRARSYSSSSFSDGSDDSRRSRSGSPRYVRRTTESPDRRGRSRSVSSSSMSSQSSSLSASLPGPRAGSRSASPELQRRPA